MSEEEMIHPGVTQPDAQGRAPPEKPWQVTKGPVRILCDEIGFPWDRRLERTDVFVAFVRELVNGIAFERDMAARISGKMGRGPPSEASAKVLALAYKMLDETAPQGLIDAAASLHMAAYELNPEDGYPTDHLIDMLVSCASALRFGLETPAYHSRHAASAADHVWRRLYGLSRFDSHTPAWGHDWARGRLIDALLSLLPPFDDGSEAVHTGQLRDEPNV